MLLVQEIFVLKYQQLSKLPIQRGLDLNITNYHMNHLSHVTDMSMHKSIKQHEKNLSSKTYWTETHVLLSMLLSWEHCFPHLHIPSFFITYRHFSRTHIDPSSIDKITPLSKHVKKKLRILNISTTLEKHLKHECMYLGWIMMYKLKEKVNFYASISNGTSHIFKWYD